VTKMARGVRKLFYENALWLVALGLMLASSGIDGAYMAQWMPFSWMGYVLNTTTDVAGMAIVYYYGVLIRDNSKHSKKHKLARVLIGAEVVTVWYSWFFSWRQFKHVMITTEPIDGAWVAPISAAFVPLLLAFIGWTQSLLYEPDAVAVAPKVKVQSTQKSAEQKPETQNQTEQIAEPKETVLVCDYCGATQTQSGKPFLKQAQMSAHLRYCEKYKAQKAQED